MVRASSFILRARDILFCSSSRSAARAPSTPCDPSPFDFGTDTRGAPVYVDGEAPADESGNRELFLCCSAVGLGANSLGVGYRAPRRRPAIARGSVCVGPLCGADNSSFRGAGSISVRFANKASCDLLPLQTSFSIGSSHISALESEGRWPHRGFEPKIAWASTRGLDRAGETRWRFRPYVDRSCAVETSGRIAGPRLRSPTAWLQPRKSPAHSRPMPWGAGRTRKNDSTRGGERSKAPDRPVDP